MSKDKQETEEPQAKYNRLQRIGLSLAAIFAAAVCVYIFGNKVFDNIAVR